jgi:transposase
MSDRVAQLRHELAQELAKLRKQAKALAIAWHHEAQQMRDAGMSLADVGQQFGVSGERIRQVTNKPPADVQAQIFANACRQIGPDKIAQMRTWANAGLSISETASRLGVSYNSVAAIARRNGFVFARPKRTRKCDVSLAASMFMLGETPRNIAPLCGFKNEASVRTCLHRMGLTVKHRNALGADQ